MAWRFHGRASVRPSNPAAFGVCDRCGFWYQLSELVYQLEWRGNALMSTGIKVCTRTCYDKPQEQFRPQILPPDPVPVLQPRPENFTLDNQGGGASAAPGPSPPPPAPAQSITVLRGWGFAGSRPSG